MGLVALQTLPRRNGRYKIMLFFIYEAVINKNAFQNETFFYFCFVLTRKR